MTIAILMPSAAPQGWGSDRLSGFTTASASSTHPTPPAASSHQWFAVAMTTNSMAAGHRNASQRRAEPRCIQKRVRENRNV